ncbi:hypothetical protein RV11_GL002295 [Enterococcus phoeniculicola]|jgi:hypothetical protein|nr:hypothetical protein RV11_GL002295 [Enterococcus phoeniculicola]
MFFYKKNDSTVSVFYYMIIKRRCDGKGMYMDRQILKELEKYLEKYGSISLQAFSKQYPNNAMQPMNKREKFTLLAFVNESERISLRYTEKNEIIFVLHG